jgi:subtilisin family serine protease
MMASVRLVRSLGLRAVLVCGAALLAVSLPRAAQDRGRRASDDRFGGHEVVSGEALVKFRAGYNEANVVSAEDEADADPSERVNGALHRLRSRSKNVEELVTLLSRRGDVEFAEPNYIVRADVSPNDPQFPNLWGLLNTGQIISVAGKPGADIHATTAWETTTGNRNNVVAVIDTGIDYTHTDLAANVWSAPTAFSVTIGGVTINCAAGTHGFNAILNTCNPADDNDHGTHTSGTIGAVGNNGVGVTGVNWTASIMAGKFLNSSGSGSIANAIKAIEFAIQAKAKFGAQANVRVLSNSWGGGGYSQAMMDEITKANTNDMLFVAAAGNSATNNDTAAFYPADYSAPNVIAVAATDNLDALAYFSNFGPTTVHLGAPGVNVLSTIRGGSYAYYSGTSMATPHVSGAAALLLSACSLSTDAVKTTLLNTVDTIPSLTGLTITGGRLNVAAAINTCAAPATPDFSVSASPSSRTVTQGGGTSFAVNTAIVGGYAGSLSLSVTGAPAGVNAVINPSTVAAGAAASLDITTTASATTGTFPLTISASDGVTTHTAQVMLVVNAPPVPDFSIAASPSSRTVTRPAGTSYTVSTATVGASVGSIALTVSGLPSNASASFSPASVTSGASATLNISTTSSTPTGTYTLTIKGTGGGKQHTATVTLTVRRR